MQHPALGRTSRFIASFVWNVFLAGAVGALLMGAGASLAWGIATKKWPAGFAAMRDTADKLAHEASLGLANLLGGWVEPWVLVLVLGWPTFLALQRLPRALWPACSHPGSGRARRFLWPWLLFVLLHVLPFVLGFSVTLGLLAEHVPSRDTLEVFYLPVLAGLGAGYLANAVVQDIARLILKALGEPAERGEHRRRGGSLVVLLQHNVHWHP